ncbi:MAG: helix-turn-helix transcriptional regulator [Hyphomicrobiaceae bacterium]|nr:helix-turn-helix transcriptional regulator [Hyphomicrobiaceae bacterium]
MTEYLTTKELAALLRIKERKVYDLAASGRVPCSRATGKLLFPRAEIEAWIVAEQTGAIGAKPERPLPNVVLGSHDPLLDWALRESRSGLATYFDGSKDGLRRLEAREGLAAGVHLYDTETGGWNTPALLGGCAHLPVVLIEWAKRQRGLIVHPDLVKQVRTLPDINRRRLAVRQEEAGAQVLFDHLAGKAGLVAADLDRAVLARSETDAALAVLDGKAEVSFGLQSLATQYRLGFVPIIEERFDLLVDRRSWFEPSMQALLGFCRSDTFRRRAAEYPGYDVRGFETVHFNGA